MGSGSYRINYWDDSCYTLPTIGWGGADRINYWDDIPILNELREFLFPFPYSRLDGVAHGEGLPAEPASAA
ncbi:hypothetical protein [Moorena producens]|uniref:hypothetical protein n=1 Tax=Moorena producens TaxID=1155739 RepID=UPI003C73D97D